MKMTIEINNAVYEKASRYTLDPVEHCKTMFEHWAQMAEQSHLGVDVLTLPSLAEQEQKRKDDEAQAALAYEQRKQAIEAVIARAPEAQREAVKQKFQLGTATLEQADAAIQEAIDGEAKRIYQAEQDAQARAEQASADEAAMSQRLLAMLASNPQLLDAANKAAAAKST